MDDLLPDSVTVQFDAASQYNSARSAILPGWCIVVFFLMCAAMQNSATAQESPTSAGETIARSVKEYKSAILPILQKACFECHSADNVEGNFRADQLDPDLVGGESTEWWLEVYSVLSKGEMPPEDADSLTAADRERVVQWLAKAIQAAEKLRKHQGGASSFRRLTRYEYNYALQDLLGAPWEFANDLPAETSGEEGFENDAHSLRMSVKQIQTYHQLARKALRRVTVRGAKPPVVHWSVSMKTPFDREATLLNKTLEQARQKFEESPGEQKREIERVRKRFQASASRSHYVNIKTGQRLETKWHYGGAKYAFRHNAVFAPMPPAGSHFAVLQPGSRQSLTIELGDKLPDNGTLRVRIRASRANGAKELTPAVHLSFGFQATNEGRYIQRISQQETSITAVYGEPEIYEWHIPLSEIKHRNDYRHKMKLGAQPSPSEFLRFTNHTLPVNGVDAENPAVLIEHVEIAAPVYEQWPPQTHRNIFIPSENTGNEEIYAREIIAAFMHRAWRRKPASQEIDRKFRLYEQLRSHSDDFQEAIVEVLATVLTSPKFLYVLPGGPQASETKHRISQPELATRLALLLWCSLPDQQLIELAATGRLNDHKVLEQQVSRMLADPRSQRFSKHFVTQWLKMQPLEYLRPERGAGGLDEALLESMKYEPIALFADMLQHDASMLDFIDARYLVINERLARHYGISGVRGNHFRRVTLPDALKRGGVLTQAGLLAMNSDGRDSHPVKRGVWLLTNLLNDPPPPPPPAVPVIDISDPAIAKLSLKERIEDHRNQAACRSCHQKIDPWGIAFENYDALGRWRNQTNGKSIDASSVLPDQTRLDGMEGLKQHLLQNRHQQFVRATIEKLAAFALGRQPGFADRAAIADITRQVRESGDGVATMIKCLVRSELFQTR